MTGFDLLADLGVGLFVNENGRLKFSKAQKKLMTSWKQVFLFLFLVTITTKLFNRFNSQELDYVDKFSRSESAYLPISIQKIIVGEQENLPLNAYYFYDPLLSPSLAQNIQAGLTELSKKSSALALDSMLMKASVISTAQQVPLMTLSDQQRFRDLFRLMKVPETLTPSEFYDLRQPDRVGRLYGDGLGYEMTKEKDLILFDLSPVAHLEPVNQEIKTVIQKKSFESSEKFFSQIQQRMSVVSNGQIINPRINRDLMESRSGLCAIARVLRENDKDVERSSQQIPIFFLMTSSDEMDPQGLTCLASYRYSNGKEPLYNGKCETQHTVIEFEKTSEREHQCLFEYSDSLEYKLITEVPRWNSTISFSQISHYNCDETELRFEEVSEWRKVMTKVHAAYKTSLPSGYEEAQTSDAKIQTEMSDSKPEKFETFWVEGPIVGDQCEAKAKEIIPKNAELLNFHCNTEEVPVPSQVPSIDNCSLKNNFCKVIATREKVVRFPGDYQSQCSVQAEARTDNLMMGTVKCHLTGKIRTSVQSLPQCRPVLANAKDQKVIYTEDLSDPVKCQEKARSLGAFVDPKYPATCASKIEDYRSRKEGQIQLSQIKRPDHSFVLDQEIDCPFDVKQKIAETEKVLLDQVVRCRVSPGTKRYRQVKLIDSTCQQQAQQFCRQNPQFVNCGLKSDVSSGVYQKKLAIKVDEKISCNDLCGTSKTRICGSDENNSLKISDYLEKSSGGSGRCLAKSYSTQTLKSYFAVKKNELESQCPLVYKGAPVDNKVIEKFNFEGYYPEFVVGQKVEDGRLKPAFSLKDFIVTRLKELYGEQVKNMTFFIQREGDPIGSHEAEGRIYSEVAKELGAQVYPINSTELSNGLIEAYQMSLRQLRYRFKLNSWKDSKKVLHIRLRKKSDFQLVDIKESDWVQIGDSIQLSPHMSIEIGDEIEVLYQ